MFIGSMDTLDTGYEQYNKIILDTLNYLKNHDFSGMADGRYAVDDKIFFNLNRYKTKEIDECRPECHRKYIDIQYMAKGEECLGWCPLSPDLTELAPYDADKDVVFYKELIPESCIILTQGSFAVLYPEDVHRPCMYVDEPGEPVTKIVVKIPVALLEE